MLGKFLILVFLPFLKCINSPFLSFINIELSGKKTNDQGTSRLSIIILYIGLVAWIISFDSFYALEDIDDDKKIGINSTPILWGDKTIFIANVLHLIFYASLLLIAYLNEFSIFFLFTMGILLLLLYYQNQLAKKELYLNAFKTNNYIGLVAVLGFAVEIFLI